MLIAFGIIAIIIGCGAVLVGGYLNKNMTYNQTLINRAIKAGFEEKQATLPDGSIINYGEGPNNGPALLLIHGQTVAWEDYASVLPQLSKSFHVYAVDCYGHGQSSSGTGLYSAQANGEALAWFMRSVIGQQSYVSGHSSGGILAAWLAANASEMVKGLVLEDPPLFRVTPEEITAGAGAFAWYDAYQVTHGFVNQTEEQDFSLYYLKNGYLLSLFGGLKDKIIPAAQQYRQQNPDLPIQLAWVPQAWLRTLLFMDDYDPQFGNAFYNGVWMQGIDQQQMLAGIACPTIYLKAVTQYGKDGVLYAANTDEDADRVQSLISNSERVDIKSGHDIHFEHPNEFIKACKALLAVP